MTYGRLALALLALLLAGHALAAETARVEAAHLRFNVPTGWTRVPAVGETEAARYRLPAAAGDQAETELVLRTRGGTKDGVADEQLDRWCDRFTQSDSRPTRAVATVVKRRLDDVRIMRADVSGTYVGSPGGAVQAGVSGYRLLGAVVEGDGGPWVFEVLGPNATVGDARADFDALLFSLELHR